MAHDAFISYSSKDKAIADAVCHALESRKVRCWIAPRDVLPGTSFEKSIIDAINDSRVFILVFSASSNTSPHVENEIKIAWNKGIPIIPFRIEDVQFKDVLNYYLGSTHWLDAFTRPMEQHLNKLCDTVEKLVPATRPAQAAVPEQPAKPVLPAKRRIPFFVIGAVAVLLLVIVSGVVILLYSGILTAGNASPGGYVPPAGTATPSPAGGTGLITGAGSVPADTNYYAMFGANPRRTGVYSTTGPAGAPAQKWAFRTNASVKSTPAVSNGTVYAGSDDAILYAIDAMSGDLKWKFQAPELGYAEDQIQSSPAVVNGTVYFASHYGATLYALDAETGLEKWNYPLASPSSSSPCVADDIVYISSSEGACAIDSKSGAGFWKYTMTNPVSSSALDASPAVADGVAVIVDYSILLGLDARTGSELWRYKAEYGFDGGPSISNGVVYINGDTGKVFALDLATGDPLWKSDWIGMTPWGSNPGIADGIVFKPGSTGTMDAIDAKTGTKTWTFETGDHSSMSGSPAIVGNTVYAGCENGYLYALNAKTGMAQWKFKAKDKISSSPSVANGIVYFGCDDHYLYAIG